MSCIEGVAVCAADYEPGYVLHTAATRESLERATSIQTRWVFPCPAQHHDNQTLQTLTALSEDIPVVPCS